MCEHKFVSSECTRVCVECGIAFPSFITTDVKRYTVNQPLWVGYNKSNRFRNMVLALFKPLTHSSIPGKMIQHLQKFPKFESVKGIFQCMKTAVCCRDKKYNSMHLYAVVFCKNYKLLKPPLPKIISDLIGDFIVLESGHQRLFPNKRFFSYRWVLTSLLKKYKLFSWVKYVKRLKNKSSCKRYTKMFETIMSLNKHVPVRDKVPVTETQPALRRGGVFQSRSRESFELNLSGSVLPPKTREVLCPTQCGLPGNSYQLGAREDSQSSILRKLYASYIQKESILGPEGVEHSCPSVQASVLPVPPLI